MPKDQSNKRFVDSDEQRKWEEAAEREGFLSFDSSTWMRQSEETEAEQDSGHPEIPGLIVGEKIGSGGSSTVFKATMQTQSDRTFAVKVLKEPLSNRDSLLRFNRETNVLQKLKHPNITKLYQFGVTRNGQPFLVLEYIDGVRLDRYLESLELTLQSEGGSLKEQVLARKLQLLIEICEAVQFAHEQGVLHRDLKPGNIVVTPDGRPMLMDFGLAKGHRDDDLQLEQTHSGAIIGTLNFLAPEQMFSIRGGVAKQTDVFGLGAILHVALTGVPPFCFTSYAEAVTQYYKKLPDKLTKRFGVPKKLEAICLKALAPSGSDRYESARELADDLRRYLAGKTVEAQANRLTRRVSLIHRQYPWLFRNAILLIVTMTIASVFFYSSWQTTAAALADSRQKSETLKELVLELSARVREQEDTPETIEDRLRILETMETALAKLAHEVDADFELLHESAMVDYRLGQILFQIKSSAESRKYFARASEKFKRLEESGYDVAASRFGLFHSYLRSDNIQAAYDEIMALIEDSPDKFDYVEAGCTMNFHKANILRNQGDTEQSLIFLEKGNQLVNRLKPGEKGWSRACRKKAQAESLSAYLHVMESDFETALDEMDRAIEHYDDFEVYACSTEGECRELVELYRAAMGIAALNGDSERVIEYHLAAQEVYELGEEAYAMRPLLFGARVEHLIDFLYIADIFGEEIDAVLVDTAFAECDSIFAIWHKRMFEEFWFASTLLEVLLLSDRDRVSLNGEVISIRELIPRLRNESILAGRTSLRLGEFDQAVLFFSAVPETNIRHDVATAYLRLLNSEAFSRFEIPGSLSGKVGNDEYRFGRSISFRSTVADGMMKSDVDYLAGQQD